MPNHIVLQGETIPAIAHQYGFADWRNIWEHPRNEHLAEMGRTPNILNPGDRVYIPDYDSGIFIFTTGRNTEIRLLNPWANVIRISFQDRFGNPYSGKRCQVEIGGNSREGESDGNGLFEFELPREVSSAIFKLWPDDANDDKFYVWILRPGYLNPVTEISGAKARLKNLGYGIDGIDDNADRRTQNAVELLRAQHELPIGTDFSDEVRRIILERHGGI